MKKWKTLKPTDWLILISVVSLFLPHTLCAVIVSVCMCIALFKFGLIEDIKHQKKNIFGFLFGALSLIVSLCYKNTIGVGISFSIFLIVIYGSYIHEKMNSKVFSLAIECSLIASLFVCIYSLFQFNTISVENGYRFLDFHIFNSPKRRIFGTFQNANIYALIGLLSVPLFGNKKNPIKSMVCFFSLISVWCTFVDRMSCGFGTVDFRDSGFVNKC